ncbi:hypothetical protein [Bacillus sp. EAC]|uniref:hypothetical protein n=1 Tax=Bacillus sp. EAC TaxID=1978338 RepID=UPI001C4F0C7D|nr:hypothetical protein [Bacillus sp. EAC]
MNNVIGIESKTNPDNLRLRIIDGTSPLGLVGLSDILLLPTNTYSFNYGTTQSINMSIQLGILFTSFGQFTGSIEVKSLTTGVVIKIIPITIFVTLL